MSTASSINFVDALLRAPAGVALLASLETMQRRDTPWHGWFTDCDEDAVARAASSVSEMPYGVLLEKVVTAGERLAGPWTGNALMSLPYSYQFAPLRRPIAEALAERFYTELHRDVDSDAQEWWCEEMAEFTPTSALFGDLSKVYENGELPLGGLWTVTDPPSVTHDALVTSWDFFGRPTSRWRIPVNSDARIWEIHAPEDWTRLVEKYPKVANGPHSGWELPGPNQHVSDSKMLRSITGQHAVRTEIGVHLVPDWPAVAEDFDGIHLSWAGFLTTEGFVSDLSNGSVAMMRYWGSEHTLWLRDVFAQAVPLGPPTFTGSIGGSEGIDVTRDEERKARDVRVLRTLLGR